jgi:ATP-dependent exoDNAse (exonuclease V) beta subunit
MLKKDAEGEGKLIRYIYDRHSYFLIDEFQDTNPMQAEIFFYLSSENPVSAWYECVPRPGSLFIVGDPKQSIYHFRGADVSSFLKIKKLFEKQRGELLMLSRNFRSTEALCGFFNRVFKKMLPHETAYQSKFEEIPLPGRGNGEFQGVYKYSAYSGKLIEEHPEETDPLQIKKIINTLVDNDAYLICGKKGEEPRHIRYSDIMVITYGKKKLAPIMQVLGEAGIPTKVEGAVPFGQNAALIEIYKIYSALADPNDCISLYGALTGGIIGLDIEDIQLYRKENGVISLHFDLESIDLKEEAACKVAAEIKKLKKLRNASYKLSPAALFAKIMDDSRVYLTSELKDPEVVYYTFELLREAEKSGAVVSHMDGVAYIEQLLGGNSDKERCLSLSDSIDAVHMANLHKVKGLEAPIVILAATPQFQKSNDLRVVHKEDSSEGYLLAISKPGNNNGYYFETSEFAEEKNAESVAGDAEHIRLIYVAATRARNALIVCDSIQAQGRGKAQKSEWKELLAEASDFNFSEEADDDGKKAGAEKNALAIDLYDEAEKTCVLNDRSREKASYSVGVPSHIKLASKLSEEQEVNVITVPDDMIDTAEEGTPEKDDKENGAKDKIKYHLLPALVGTMTHRLMEMLVSSKNMINDKEAIREVINEYITPATEKYEKQLRTMLENVVQTIRSGGYPQINGAPQDILGTLLAADEVYCEVPFSYKEDTEEGQIVWNGIMDVVYASGGKWHIVDYKTNADGSDLDKNYKDQLDAYIKAFKATTGQDAGAKTYHINV